MYVLNVEHVRVIQEFHLEDYFHSEMIEMNDSIMVVMKEKKKTDVSKKKEIDFSAS